MQAVATHSAAPAVTIYNGIPTVLSTNIADVFGKRHDHVLRDIESILKTTPEERLNNFIKINIATWVKAQIERAAFAENVDYVKISGKSLSPKKGEFRENTY